MKNLHVLPTDKPSRIYLNTGEWFFENDYSLSVDECINQNIYITSDERIERGDWLFDAENEEHIYRASDVDLSNIRSLKSWYCKKIILTTDQDLIKYGVQAVEEDFLNWFVKNPSCEEIEAVKFCKNQDDCPSCLDIYAKQGLCNIGYKIIIIPKEEAKQETLEEFAKQEAIKQYSEDTFGNLIVRKSIEKGAKWQQERSYSEEEVSELVDMLQKCKEYFLLKTDLKSEERADAIGQVLEQFKNK